jgi:hypothetical protein
VAGWVRVPGLWRDGGAVAPVASPLDVPVVSASVVGDGRHDLREDESAAQDVVCRGVVPDELEDWHQRVGAAEGAGSRELPDGVVDAAQVAAGDGASGTGSLGTTTPPFPWIISARSLGRTTTVLVHEPVSTQLKRCSAEPTLVSGERSGSNERLDIETGLTDDRADGAFG